MEFTNDSDEMLRVVECSPDAPSIDGWPKIFFENEYVEAQFRQALDEQKDGTALVLLLVKQSMNIGFASLRHCTEDLEDTCHVYTELAFIYIEPDHREQGLALNLMDEIIRRIYRWFEDEKMASPVPVKLQFSCEPISKNGRIVCKGLRDCLRLHVGKALVEPDVEGLLMMSPS